MLMLYFIFTLDVQDLHMFSLRMFVMLEDTLHNVDRKQICGCPVEIQFTQGYQKIPDQREVKEGRNVYNSSQYNDYGPYRH